MSGTFFVSPDPEIQKQAAHGAATAFTGLPVGLLAALLPDPSATGVAAAVPGQGAAANMVDFAHMIDRFGNKAGAAVLPGWLDKAIPTIPDKNPVYDWGERVAGETMKQAEQIVPHVEPRSPDEEVLSHAGESAGAMGVPIPGVAAPKLLQAIMPGTRSLAMLPAAGGLSAVAETSLAPSPQPTTPPPLDVRTMQPSGAPPADIKVPMDDIEHPDSKMTWGEWAIGGAATIALLAGGGRAVGMAERAAASRRLAAYGQQQLIKPTELRPSGEVQAPLPGKGDSIGTGLAEANIDRNARLNAVADEIAPTKTDAEALRAQIGITHNDQAFHARHQVAMDIGEDAVTGIKFPAPNNVAWRLANKLTADQRAVYDEARHAGNEMDNRARNGGQSVGLSEFTDAELRAKMAAGQADPAVRQLISDQGRIHDVYVDIGVARGIWTKAEGNALKAAHPHYVPDADLNGIVVNPLEARDITAQSGPKRADFASWDLDQQHAEKMFRAFERNDLDRNFIQTAYDWQRRTGTNSPLFTESRDARGDWVKPKNDSGYGVRVNGELQWHNVPSRALLNALKQTPGTTNTLFNGVNQARNFMQSNITGTGAMLAGHVYPAINAVRSAGVGALIRPEGTYGGYLEKGVSKLTGGKVNIGDPTAALTMPYEWAAGGGAHVAKGFAAILHPDARGPGRWLRSAYGDNFVNAIHNKMQGMWRDSITFKMQQGGAANASGMTASYVPSEVSGSAGRVFSPTSNMVPELYRARGMAKFVDFNEFVNMVKSVIGEAGNRQYFRLNEGHVPLEQNIHNTRQLTGDPGAHGSGGLAKGIAATIPYSNIAAQATTALVRSYKANPGQFMLRTITALGVPAMAEVASMMMHGPDAVLHNETDVDNRNASSNVRIYIPGKPVEEALRIPLDPSDAPFYPLMREFIKDVIGLKAHGNNPGVAQWAWDGMMDFFGTHIKQNTIDQTVNATSNVVSPTSLGVLDILPTIAGKQLDPSIDAAYQNSAKLAQGDIPGTFARNTQSGIKAPGIGSDDALFGSESGKFFKNAISATFGVMGSLATQYATDFKVAYDATHDASYAFGNMVRDYKSSLQESFPYANGVLWNHDDRLATQTPLVQRVEQSKEAIRPLLSWKAGELWHGYTRSRGVEIPNAPGSSTLASDATMQQMVAVAAKYGQLVTTKLDPPINDLRDQLKELENSPLSPEAVRKLRNGYVREIQNRYEDEAIMLQDANNTLSQLAGKHVTVTTVDWNKGAEQFAR